MDIDEFDYLSVNLKYYLENMIGLFFLRDILFCVVNILFIIYIFMFLDFCVYCYVYVILFVWV